MSRKASAQPPEETIPSKSKLTTQKPKSKVSITNLESPVKNVKTPTRHTAYFVTINPNVSFQDNQDQMWEFADVLKESLDELLDDPEEIQSILNWNTR
jgi:hypothetical protein